jgi:putative lipoic acid-binding regulatory protein
MPPLLLAPAVVIANRGVCSGAAAGPDASRYDVEKYGGLWRNLSREAWPSDHILAIIGPADDSFVQAVKACCEAEDGCEIVQLSTQSKSRWQSVRLSVRCTSPDDFCALHSRLAALEGVKALV